MFAVPTTARLASGVVVPIPTRLLSASTNNTPESKLELPVVNVNELPTSAISLIKPFIFMPLEVLDQGAITKLPVSIAPLEKFNKISPAATKEVNVPAPAFGIMLIPGAAPNAPVANLAVGVTPPPPNTLAVPVTSNPPAKPVKPVTLAAPAFNLTDTLAMPVTTNPPAAVVNPLIPKVDMALAAPFACREP